MLSRALLRSTKPPTVRQSPAIFGIASSTVWTRTLARHNRPNHQQNQQNQQNRKPAESSRPPGAPPKQAQYTAPQRSSSKFQAPNLPRKQTDATSERNTTTQSESRGAGAPSPDVLKDEDFSRKQDEYEAAMENGLKDDEPSKQPEQPLPDLTQGIPSTIEFELNESAKRDPLDLTQAEEPTQSSGGGGRGKGELPASAYVSSGERKRLRFANYMYAAFAVFAATGYVFLGRNWETEEEETAHPDAPSGWAFGLMWARAKARLGDQLNYYSEPAFPKLLPNLDPIFERPYTLVLSLEDLLIHSEWSREHGWRMAKRPGVDYFLRYLSQYYELVIFTSQPWAVADPIIRKLDPYHIVTWPLFREATLYEKGEYIKDLSYLNRDLSKVILIDTVPHHAKKQPENAIILKKWEGQVGDKELVSLIPFLEYIHTMNYSDVRKAIKSFEGTHIPTEFAKREAVARKRFQEQIEEEQKKRPKHSGLGLLGNALGIKSGGMMVMTDGEQSPAEAFAQGKMLQDQARERGQRNYESLEREIRENGEKWLKEEAAQEEKMKEEGMKAMKTGFTSWLPGSSGTAPPK